MKLWDKRLVSNLQIRDGIVYYRNTHMNMTRFASVCRIFTQRFHVDICSHNISFVWLFLAEPYTEITFLNIQIAMRFPSIFEAHWLVLDYYYCDTAQCLLYYKHHTIIGKLNISPHSSRNRCLQINLFNTIFKYEYIE